MRLCLDGGCAETARRGHARKRRKKGVMDMRYGEEGRRRDSEMCAHSMWPFEHAAEPLPRHTRANPVGQRLRVPNNKERTINRPWIQY